MNVDTDEFLKSLKSLQVSRCECSAKNPDSDYPNQHTKACPRFQTMHCWCPPATGPNQPHEKDCFQYTRPVKKPVKFTYAGVSKDKGPFFGHGLQYQAQAYAAGFAVAQEAWQEAGLDSIKCNEFCTCAAKSGVIGHAAFCPLGAAAGEKP
jgi:hypothetical protein